MDDVRVRLEFPDRDSSKSDVKSVFDPTPLITSVNTFSLKVRLTVKLSDEIVGAEI